jgi:nitrite reductase (NADH) large subunit
MAEQKIIIIGGGIAGLTAADAARSASPGARVTLVHNEPDLPYNRLNLTRLIAGEIEESALMLHDASWYSENRIEPVCGDVVAINRAERQIVLKSGKALEYSSLVIATGSSPFLPPIPGADKPGVMTLRTIRDARKILESVSEGTKCVCIGGGLLGIELSAGLRKRGASVVILENSEWLLSRQLVKPAGALLRERIEELGMEVHCGAKVKQIMGTTAAEGVLLENGERFEAELVAISAGVRPNTALAVACGLTVGRGIKVDDRMATSDPNIYAAGDVAEFEGQAFGLWPIAMSQGEVAGANAAGADKIYRATPPPAFLKVVGVDVFSIGDFMPKDSASSIFDMPGSGTYLSLTVKSGLLTGANMVGDISAAQLVKRTIEGKAPIDQNQKLLGRFPGLAEFMLKVKD